MKLLKRAGAIRSALAMIAVFGCGDRIAMQTATTPLPQTTQAPAPDSAVLADSEITVVESGGIAGRIHSVRLVATDGRIQIEYRAPEARTAAAPFTGTIEPRPYLDLWRQLEAAGAWRVESPPPTRGADLTQVDVRIRLAAVAHAVRWDEGSQQATALRPLGEVTRRALALGRQATFAR